MYLADYIRATRPFLAVSGLGSIAAIIFIWGQGLEGVWLPANTTGFVIQGDDILIYQGLFDHVKVGPTPA